MATASNPNIYMNKIQYCIYFCIWFHYNLLKPCAIGNIGTCSLLWSINKIGSRQTTVKAFWVVCDYTIFLDQWILDKDWVGKI
jgi:hypothetical protein